MTVAPSSILGRKFEFARESKRRVRGPALEITLCGDSFPHCHPERGIGISWHSTTADSSRQKRALGM